MSIFDARDTAMVVVGATCIIAHMEKHMEKMNGAGGWNRNKALMRSEVLKEGEEEADNVFRIVVIGGGSAQ